MPGVAAPRRSLAQVLGVDDPSEDAPAAAWAWRDCACGTRFLGPAGRTRCLVCRTGATVVRLGRGRAEDDDEPGVPAEEGARVAHGKAPLPIDREALTRMRDTGAPPEIACIRFGVTARQLVQWCTNHRFRYPGLPANHSERAIEAMQAQVEALRDKVARTVKQPDAGPVRDGDAARAASEVLAAAAEAERAAPAVGAAAPPEREPQSELQPEPPCEPAPAATPPPPAAAAPTPGPTVAVPVSAAPPAPPEPNPYRVSRRTGEIVLTVRVEGARIALDRDPAVRGDITDAEAEIALQSLREWCGARLPAAEVAAS
jgi:hypothetical protein